MTKNKLFTVTALATLAFGLNCLIVINAIAGTGW